MKKENIINLIKYHTKNDDEAFKDEAYEIAKEFNNTGDSQLAEYILSMIQDNNFRPQEYNAEMKYLVKLSLSDEPLLLPDSIIKDLIGIGNAIKKDNLGVNKFLFSGKPGTGKTEAAKQLGRLLDMDVFYAEISSVIDSKLGETQKNIRQMFLEINNLGNFKNAIVIFDEIDSLALDRLNKNDLREMGRATSEILKGLDELNKHITLVATTNLLSAMDKALVRRFDYVIDFNRYEREDLIKVGEKLLDYYLHKYKLASREIKIFRKIINLCDEIPYPAELKNIIRTSIAFCNPQDDKDYLRNIYTYITGNDISDIKKMQELNFSVREIELLSSVPKSTVSRELRVNK